MKAITLGQPGASFIALGIADIAVLPHSAPADLWGERIALQASETRARPGELPSRVLRRGVSLGADWNHPSWRIDRFPLGSVVGIACLRFGCEIIPTPPDKIGLVCAKGENEDVEITVEFPLNEDHDYRIGSHLWFFQDAELLPQHIVAQGHSGLWDWTPPSDALRENPRARLSNRRALDQMVGLPHTTPSQTKGRPS